MNPQVYLVRYGAMGHVSRLPSDRGCVDRFERDQVVVVQTDRGVELGEVLIALDGVPPSQELADSGEYESPCAKNGRPRVLRKATASDLEKAQRLTRDRWSRLSVCEQILRAEAWPCEIVDVELLLEEETTILHYLGPHHLDTAGLRARFRRQCDFDVVFEPAGIDLDAEDAGHAEHAAGQGCGNCGGSGGCHSGGGDHNTSDDATENSRPNGGCAVGAHSGCSSCGISRLIKSGAQQTD